VNLPSLVEITGNPKNSGVVPVCFFGGLPIYTQPQCLAGQAFYLLISMSINIDISHLRVFFRGDSSTHMVVLMERFIGFEPGKRTIKPCLPSCLSAADEKMRHRSPIF
jgi:hypothetical protein